MARCGCGTGCSCVIQSAGDCVTVTGNGSIRLPYLIDVVVDPFPDNLLECDRDGLYVDPDNLPDAVVVATNGVSGDGTGGDPLVAAYSTDASNQAVAGTDGHIFVPFPTINSDPTISGDGTGGSPLSVFVSTDAGNVLGTGGDGGLYTLGGGASVVQTDGSSMLGDGSGGDQIRLQLRASQLDQLEVDALGLRYNLLGEHYTASEFLNMPPGTGATMQSDYDVANATSDAASVFTTNMATGDTTIILGGYYAISCSARSIFNIALGDDRWNLATLFTGFTGLPFGQRVGVELNLRSNEMSGFTGQTVAASGVVRLSTGNVISTFGRLIKAVGGGAATVDHRITRTVSIFRLGTAT